MKNKINQASMAFGALGGLAVFGMLLTHRRWPGTEFVWFVIFVIVWATMLQTGVVG